MTKVSYSNIDKYPSLEASPSNASRQADFQKKIAEVIAQMLPKELALDAPKDSDDVNLREGVVGEPDDSQPLTVEPPLTLSKIFSKLTAVERLWVARMVKSHGKELVLARWPAYEIHINYVRYLR